MCTSHLKQCHGYPCSSASHVQLPSGCPVPQEELCSICLEVANIDAQIIRTEFLLSDLHRKRIITKNKRLNQLHDPLSFIPLEVASQIFAFFVNDSNGSFSDWPKSRYHNGFNWSPSFFLASICKGWRQIALITPELWTSIRVQIYSLSTILLQAETLTQCLARSGNRSLAIAIYAENAVAEETNNNFNFSPLFDTLRQCASRWRELALRLPTCWYGNFIPNFPYAPRLETLQLRHVPGFECNDQFNLHETPCLTSLDISDLLLSQINVHWNNLTIFRAEIVSVDEIFEVLRRATQLLRCRLGPIMDDTGHFPIPITPVAHSSLKNLHLEFGCTVATMATLFDYIELPSLGDLSIDCSCPPGGSTVPWRSLRSLFERSRSPLIKFSLLDKRLDGTNILSLLEVLPTLRDLHLEGGKMLTDYVLEGLGEHTSLKDGTSQFRIFPSRRSLTYKGECAFSWRTLLDAFYAGWEEALDVTQPSRPPIATVSTKQPFCFRFLQVRSGLGEIIYIDAKSASHLARLQKKFPLEIVDVRYGLDLIKVSLQYHGHDILDDVTVT
ncbi:hypothetical protein GALMADRAFT_236814 [Galerina marginata CBS 339.88]|uniref:F-box domain-containing protein n=1 Tax=Galerina marginata (strain CBS 339.88) TaxID=685588 RepID=A0A067TLP0_GALM3|nr:hypothetical protein GALMADRAFT_236814 [Galerina marginata CBS 339.88]